MEASEWWVGLTREAVPAPDYEGLTVAEAQAMAARRGVEVRVVSLDGSPKVFGVTLDLRSDRVTLMVREGSVIRAAIF